MKDPVDPASPRVTHDTVKDSGETPAATSDAELLGTPGRRVTDPTGFRFNLDDALARLSEPHQPIPRFQWSAVTPSTTEPAALQGPMHNSSLAGPQPSATAASVRSTFPDQESRGRPLTQPTLDPLPEIREATAVGGTPALAHWSTIPVHTPSPVALAPAVLAAPPAAPAPADAPAIPMIVTGTAAFASGAIGFTPDAGDAPASGVVLSRRAGDGLPRLPASDPAAAPPMATMKTMTAPVSPSTATASAARGRQKRKRRRRGKFFLVLFLLAGMVGAALMFGRDYLFPEDWAKDVAPTVDALQLSSGLEFVDPVVVNTLPPAEYATKVADAMFGPAFGTELTESVPRWRALGLVDGDPTVASMNATVGTWKPAFYDPGDGQIYRSATATGPALEAAMLDSLAAALVDQLAPETPAPAADATATASLAHLALADHAAELVAGPATTFPDRSALATLPVPMAHRLFGVEDLGDPILESLGVLPDRAMAITGFGVDAAAVLDVPWTAAPVPAMLEGDTQDGGAAARGSDFWYTVLAAYLPADTAADAANSIGADLYVPAVRGAQQCVYAMFTATTPDALSVLQVAAVAWTALAPAAAGAQATTLADGVTVQLSVCDPGTAPNPTRSPNVATALVARQIARLNPV